MHKGRTYPFLPRYWATEAWFWPGFVPWRFLLHTTGPLTPPWNAIPTGIDLLSDAGDSSTNIKQPAWAFDASHDGFTCLLDLVLDKITDITGSYARWRLFISNGGPAWAVGIALQPYPQYVVNLPRFDFSLPTPPYTSPAGPLISVRPATYAEGGSPWH